MAWNSRESPDYKDTVLQNPTDLKLDSAEDDLEPLILLIPLPRCSDLRPVASPPSFFNCVSLKLLISCVH